MMPALDVDQKEQDLADADDDDRTPMPAELAGLAEAAVSPAMAAESVSNPTVEIEAPRSDNGRESVRDHAEQDDEGAEVEPAAILSEPAAPRRGWWNRFVRKSD